MSYNICCSSSQALGDWFWLGLQQERCRRNGQERAWIKDNMAKRCSFWLALQRKCSRKRWEVENSIVQDTRSRKLPGWKRLLPRDARTHWCGTYVDRHLLETGVGRRVRKWLTERGGRHVRASFCFRLGWVRGSGNGLPRQWGKMV